MDAFKKMLDAAQSGKAEAEELISQVNEGLEPFPSHMSRQRALEVLHGCIDDYTTMIKRLGGRNPA